MRHEATDFDLSETGPITVLVDGKRADKCVAFDLDRGYADVLALDRDGAPIRKGDEIWEIRLFGEINFAPLLA